MLRVNASITPPSPSAAGGRMVMRLSFAVWLTLAAGGAALLSLHASIPGPAIHANSIWPAGDRLPRQAGMFTLVMTVHPDCPCSRASLNELQVLMTRCQGRLNALVLFDEPAGLTHDSAGDELWASGSAIPGVQCLHDPKGELTNRFGAQTSGQVFVYDPDGVLRFSGGITFARGHAGDSDGLNAITDIVNGKETAVKQTPVFGCSLR